MNKAVRVMGGPASLLVALLGAAPCGVMAAAGGYGTEAAQAPTRVPGPPPLKFSTELGAGYDSNVGNAQRSVDVRASGFANVQASAEYTHRFSLYSALALKLSALAEQQQEQGFSQQRGGVMLRFSFRSAGGFFTPAFSTWLSASAIAAESDIREGLEYRAGFAIIEQLTTQLSGRFSLGATQREAESRVFDLKSVSASLNLDWAASPVDTLYGGYQFQDGDLVSSGTPTFDVVRAAEEIEADDALGGFAANQFAYRLEAQTHVLSAGFNHRFNRRYAFDAQMQYVRSDARYGNRYERVIAALSLLARF